MDTHPRDCDILVIGGGPAGTTAATLLKARGWRVTLLEKARHPRFHIGESLLPKNMPILEKLGVLSAVDALGVTKHGADFSDHHEHAWQAIYFRDAIDATHGHAYQVRRDQFDQLLFENSKQHGVDVHEGVQVNTVVFDEADRALVEASNERGHASKWRAKLVVDASGRDTFLSSKLGLKHKNRKHQSAAVFAHFANAACRSGKDEGNISIYWFEHGWFWMIPLKDGLMSIGAVCRPEYLKTRRTALEPFLRETMNLCVGVRERTRHATMVTPARAAGNYSYSSTKMHGRGYVLLGDAFAFIDPVFSSGVYLAMHGAAAAVDPIDATLRGAPDANRRMRQFERRMRRGLNTLSWFIYRFTSPATRTLFMAPKNVLRMQSAVISVLAGDVFGARRLHLPLTCFKIVYFVFCARDFCRSRVLQRSQRKDAPAPS